MYLMKNYVLDTTVLLYDAQALYGFDDNCVIVPLSVIEEIDHFKKDLSEIGRNARQASRYLDGLRKQGPLSTGVELPGGGMIIVKVPGRREKNRSSAFFNYKSKDEEVLATALTVKDESEHPTVLITKDVYLRIKADALGVTSEDYESDKVDIEELYTGYRETYVDTATVDAMKKNGVVPEFQNLLPNEYVAVIDRSDPEYYGLGRFDGKQGIVVPLVKQGPERRWRIDGRNREQAVALDALFNDEIGLVSLVGKAGTGKTLLAIAAAIYKTVDENVFHRILVSRPTLPMGKDIGYLPGTAEEKLMPWMYPIADNVELIMRGEGRARRNIRGFRELIDMGILVIEPLTYIRGRSIHNQFLIVDEAQNLTPHEIKTIITRVGDGTKIVLTGDPYQIDNPYIDSSSNGLAYVVERFKDQSAAAHVTLKKGERSQLSELAANLL